VHSWINPTSVLGGVLAVVVVAFLASVYLVWEAGRLADGAMVEYFRRRAIGAAIVAGLVAFIGLFVLKSDSPYLYDGLTSRGLPLVILSAGCGVGALILLLRDNHRGARLLAIGAVASIVVSWGVAQWDFILPQTLTVAQAAAPSATLTTVLVVTVLAVLIILPAFGLLYVLDQRGMLEGEGVVDELEDEPERVPT
jgi:cytochrome d ubiquinol oxidase subunit II